MLSSLARIITHIKLTNTPSKLEEIDPLINNEENVEKQDPSHVIVGLGPTGLALAIEACRKDSKKKKVIAITDRQEYTRDAIFRLDVDIFPYLEELVGSDQIADYFKRHLIGPRESLNGWDFHVIQMKTLEKLLYNTLSQEKNVQIICFPKGSTNQIIDIDKVSHTITFKQKNHNAELIITKIPFKYLIAADGPHHHIADMVAGKSIEYHETQHEQLYKKHARITYKLPDHICTEQFRELLQPVNMQLSDISLLKELGWPLESNPEVRVFVVDGYLFIAAECPPEFQNCDNKAIDEWFRAIFKYICPQSDVNELIRIDTATFEVFLNEANRTLLPLPASKNNILHENMAYFFQMGDALRRTHYQTGSGAVVGLREAKLFGEYLASEQTLDDLMKYHAGMAIVRADNRVRVDAFIDKRQERELAAAQASLSTSTTDIQLLAKSMSNVTGSKRPANNETHLESNPYIQRNI